MISSLSVVAMWCRFKRGNIAREASAMVQQARITMDILMHTSALVKGSFGGAVAVELTRSYLIIFNKSNRTDRVQKRQKNKWKDPENILVTFLSHWEALTDQSVLHSMLTLKCCRLIAFLIN
jgi:hypothetical protein